MNWQRHSLKSRKKFPVKNDWVTEIGENLEFCEINLNEEEMKKMSKNKF